MIDAFRDYELVSKTRCWVTRKHREEFVYSDGDEVEQRLLEIMQTATDLSSVSMELRKHIIDWPSCYHLSPRRGNLLRPIRELLKGNILEVGAGCGAITRFLGECGANVYALEGSARRAEVAAARCRDLDNVSVIVDSFCNVPETPVFDVVTLIGVLEYARTYFVTMPGDPVDAMLRYAKRFLRPGGVLVLAIENQLGLKYFAGFNEDHFCEPMFGIEDQYHDTGIATFGRAELGAYLANAGFTSQQWWYPFPDYKLPVSVLSDRILAVEKSVNLAPLLGFSVNADPQKPRIPLFSLEQAWGPIFRNGLLGDLSNSFLVVASNCEIDSENAHVIAYHFSTERRPEFSKYLIFEREPSGEVRIHRKRLIPEAAHDESCPLSLHLESQSFLNGESWLKRLNTILTSPGWCVADLHAWTYDWLKALFNLAGVDSSKASLSLRRRLPGDLFDAVPRNLMRLPDGSFEFFDQEWSLNRPIDLGFIIYRGILNSLIEVSSIAPPATGTPVKALDLCLRVCELLGLRLSESDVYRYDIFEDQIQNWASGATWPRHEYICSYVLPIRIGKENALSQLDRHVQESNIAISTLHQQIQNKDSVITDLHQQIECILATKSWRITAPLRYINKLKGAGLLLMQNATISRNLYLKLSILNQHKKSLSRRLKRIINKPSNEGNVPNTGVMSLDINERIELLFKTYTMKPADEPMVSIIIPIFNSFRYTLECLLSLSNSGDETAYEIIVVDDNSTDMTFSILEKCRGIYVIRNDSNEGFIRSCNKGAEKAKGKYLVFLNNDTLVKQKWLDELINTFVLFPEAGLVGSKLIYPDGRLQEAGCIIWNDGSAWNFGRGDDPEKPEYNYLRTVDYCSGASIMVDSTLFHELGGFDEHFAPAYGEDYDLALRIRRQGRKVLYQPLSQVYHFEGITSGTDINKGVKSYQKINATKLNERWKDTLKKHRVNGIEPELEKDRDVSTRVLVIDACTPTPDQDAGSVTAFAMMKIFKDFGYKVTFIPEDNFCNLPPYTSNLQRLGIECLYYPYILSVENYLKSVGDVFDIILIIRAPVAYKYFPYIRKHCPKARIILHTADLHYLREEREALLRNDQVLITAAKRSKQRELEIIEKVDCCIVHGNYEKDILFEETPNAKTVVFPLILDCVGTNVPFEERRDIMFLGGYQHTPNVDAVLYFVKNIFPAVKRAIPDLRFYIIGSKPPGEVMELADDNIIVTGYVPDLKPYLDRFKMSVAPLRYGAGIKGKIGQSMAHGLPCVATPIAVEGMDLRNNHEILVAGDDEEFAHKTVTLYKDKDLWNRLSISGLHFVDKTYSFSNAKTTMKEVLRIADLKNK